MAFVQLNLESRISHYHVISINELITKLCTITEGTGGGDSDLFAQMQKVRWVGLISRSCIFFPWYPYELVTPVRLIRITIILILARLTNII